MMREVIRVGGMDCLVFEKSTDPEKHVLGLGVQHVNADGQEAPPDFVDLTREEAIQVARMLLDRVVEPAVFVSYKTDRAPLPALRQLSEMEAAGEKVEKGGVSNETPLDQLDAQDSASTMAALSLLKGLRATLDQLSKPHRQTKYSVRTTETIQRCISLLDEALNLMGVNSFGTRGRGI